ncbi:MAG: DUF2796 domain-containing protein [Burkholderiales bacterium]
MFNNNGTGHVRAQILSLLFALLSGALCVFSSAAFADGSALPEYRNGNLAIDVEGNAVSARLRLPMAVANPDKPGLPPDEVLKRLNAGDKLFGFPGIAACKAESASAFAVDKEGKPVKRAGDFGNIQASYRFECGGARPESIKVKLFEQLPDLLGLKLQLTTDKGERSVDLAPGSADLAL